MQDARAGSRRGHPTKVAAYSRPCLCLDTHLTIGSIARLRTNIQATTTAQVNAIAPDGTTTSRKSGTTSTTLRDKATAKSDHSGQFFIIHLIFSIYPPGVCRLFAFHVPAAASESKATARPFTDMQSVSDRIDIYFGVRAAFATVSIVRRFDWALMSFVELDSSLVFLCRRPGGKRPQIAAAAGLRILLAGI